MTNEFQTRWQSNGTRTAEFYPDQEQIDRLKREWREFAARIEPYRGSYNGRGIVICGGGIRYFTCAWVNIHLLRKKGCTLPIELWYTGDELTEEAEMILKPLDVACKNVKDHTRQDISGYALKPFAILHSDFKEILYLDADNICTTDPTYLFDSEEYRSYGAIFWPDIWITDRSNPIWEITGSDDYQSIEQESGQILINKERCWRELNLCLFFNENSGDYYKMLWGDKDTFKFAWLALRSKYHMIATPVAYCGYNKISRSFFSKGVSLIQHDLAGSFLFIHRNLFKWDVTSEGEIVWGKVKRFKRNARERVFNTTLFFVKDDINYYGMDIEGDVEVIDFQKIFGDLELTCLQILKHLRQSDFYSRFLLHSYFVYFKPGYSAGPAAGMADLGFGPKGA